MLAPRTLSADFAAWNRKHGAPFGRSLRRLARFRRWIPDETWERLRGPFAYQVNNNTRAFEYPWAFHAGGIERGMRVAEIGGGLSGFQFVLDRTGCTVVNVDPGLRASGVGWPCDEASMRRLNARFGTTIDLRNTTARHAGLDEGACDRVFSISVLEHLPDDDVHDAMEQAFRWLKPGGVMVLTVDLFIDLYPFCERRTNRYGRNQDIRKIVAAVPFEMISGTPSELYGFPGFDAHAIHSRLEEFLVGSIHPAMVQCVVLRKPV